MSKYKNFYEKYPKMCRDAHPMEPFPMFGIECGEGWYNILDNLCGNIQQHIDWRRKKRALALKYNRALNRAIKGDTRGLVYFYSFGKEPNEQAHTITMKECINPVFRKVPDSVHQVVIEQIKEKFGTLRFYYRGGDDYISGLVAMAESMSGVTCEECGAPGEGNYNGWIRTICKPCENKRAEEYKRYHEQKESK